jgi:SAM-dependent methyltransferase
MKALELRQYSVKPILRPLLHRILSRKMFLFLRFRWWYFSSYSPRLVTSRLNKRSPQVRSFSTSRIASDLAERLQRVNVRAPTNMCRVMTKYGSDKGRAHRYTSVYSALFKERYHEPLRVFELGLGTNNPDAPSNMGVLGAPGASLRGWRELFPHALVYGADIDRRILFQEDRIKTFYCNQLDRSSIRELWAQPDLRDGLDIIIEDGLHTLEANVAFLEESLDHLRPGGIYITEDIVWNEIGQWCDRLETTYSKQYPGYDFAFVVMPNGESRSYNMLVVRRAAK